MNPTTPARLDKRRDNLRLAVVLASVALALFVGFMLKMWWMK